MNDEFLNVKQAAEYMKISDTTLYRYLKRKELVGVKRFGKWLFRKEDLDKFILSQTKTFEDLED
jgi:excisionase family DNA binding protein